MAIRMSDAATALMAGDTGLRRAIANGTLTFYTGSQPTTANDTPGTAQPIISFTNADAVFTAEVRPQWKFTLTNTTTSDTITSIIIGGASGTNGFNILGGTVTAAASDDTLMAAAVALQVNTNIGNADFTATSSSGAVIITGPIGVGTALNTALATVTQSGITITYNDGGGTGAVFTTGVASANGLTFLTPANGASLSTPELVYYIDKPPTQTWKGKNGFGPATAVATAVYTGIVNGTTYTAGWGRITCSAGDDGSTATTGDTGYVRIDFSVGTSGTDFLMAPAATFTVNTTSGSEIESVINTFRLKVSKTMG